LRLTARVDESIQLQLEGLSEAFSDGGTKLQCIFNQDAIRRQCGYNEATTAPDPLTSDCLPAGARRYKPIESFSMSIATLKSTDVRLRVEPDLKLQASQILADCGLNLSDAIRLFLRQVVSSNGLPFDVKRVPNAETLAAIREAEGISHARFCHPEKIFDEIEKASARQQQAREATAKL
jgi:DNA-damage-inducible protein J